MALKRLGVDFECWKTSDWDTNSVRSYKAIHCSEDNTDYSEKLDKEQLVQELLKLCVSVDGKNPMKEQQIRRKGEKWLRETYNCFKASRNLGSVTGIHAEDLEIDEENFTSIVSYSFPCLAGDTLVLTDKGYKQIKDVTINDYVLSHDNLYHKVIASKLTKENANTLKIKGMGFDNITCTPNHKFKIRKRITKTKKINGVRHNIHSFTEPEWVEAKDLSVGMFLGFAINQNSIMPKWEGYEYKRPLKDKKIANHISEIIDKHEFWWLVGRYLGDGWYDKDELSIRISVKTEQLSDVTNVLEILGYKYSIYEKDRPAQKVFVSNKELVAFLKQFGKGAYGKHIPGFIFDMPINYLEDIINGYESADGTIDKKGRITGSSVSKELIYGMVQLIAKTFHRTYSVSDQRREFDVIIDGRNVHSNGVYAYQYRRYEVLQEHGYYVDNQLWMPIKDIIEGDLTDVYDLEIENSHSFLANGVIVHNCQDLSLAGKQAGMDEGSGTRSSLIWEIRRILQECKEQNCLPTVLLLENVTQVCGKKNIDNWNKWLTTLEELGYHNYYKNLNAKNFGIAQNRDRTFCVSILSDKPYVFPDEIVLNKRLKDYLEPKVDENYYINTEKAEKLIADLIERGVLKNNTTAIEMKGMTNHKMEVEGKPIDVAHTLLARDYKGVASYHSNGAVEKVTIDLTINNPQKRDVANCIKARYDAGITNFAQDGIGVVENA